MNAIVFNEAGKSLDVLKYTQVDISDPSDDEVQIRIKARPINPSDEMFINGIYRQKPFFSQIAGLEGAGVIEKTGKNIDENLIGKHVSFRARGTWAELINLNLTQCRIVPENIPFEVACQLSLNGFTAYALLDAANLSAGQWLLISAASSSVGKQIIQLAQQKNIHTIALVRDDKHKDTLLSLGAKAVLNIQAEDIEDKIMQLTGDGANTALDAVGGELGTIIFNILAPFSKIIIYGRMSSDNVSFNYGTLIYKNLKIEGFGIDRWLQQKSENELNKIWNEIIQHILNNDLKITYDKTFDLSDFKNAISHYQKTSERIILIN